MDQNKGLLPVLYSKVFALTILTYCDLGEELAAGGGCLPDAPMPKAGGPTS